MTMRKHARATPAQSSRAELPASEMLVTVLYSFEHYVFSKHKF